VNGCLDDMGYPKKFNNFIHYVNLSTPDMERSDLKEEKEMRISNEDGMEVIKKHGLPQGLP
jgi:hypothetical protein